MTYTLPFPPTLTASREFLLPLLETRLEQALEDASIPPRLLEAMRYSSLQGGKRFRGLLTLLWCIESCNQYEPALADAAAIELVHTFSLIHDDLPCMDNDDLRRGKPSNHVVHGEALALLAGDGLVFRATELVASNPAGGAPAAMEAVAVLSRCSGPAGMVGGQVLDMEWERSGGDMESLRRLHRMKTGALISACGELGTLRGGGSNSVRDLARSFCEHIGLMFQISDDILDVEGDAETLGKTPGKDEGSGKLTFVSLLGLQGARRELEKLLHEAVEIAGSCRLAPIFREIATWTVNRTS